MKLLIALIVVWLIGIDVALWYFLMLFDSLKKRIDRRVDEDKWQNEYIERLYERVSKLEQEK